jgi:hypothetical protein
MHHHRPRMLAVLFSLVVSVPLFASQFVQLPFDQLARESQYIVRGTVENTWSAWDDAHEVIFTYATVRVSRYFGESTGPDTLTIREAGGTVGDYTQEAIGFPAIRQGEDVVLFLAPWTDGGAELRIHAFNQGKLLVRNRGGVEVVTEDPVKQGDARLGGDGRFMPETNAMGMTLGELATMIDAARAGEPVERIERPRQ